MDRTRLVLGVGAVALVVGLVAAAIVSWADYTLAYNDARARLVVARRVFDTLTPGFGQLGGLWLPLPHLVNLPLVHVDALYRSGLHAVALNVIALAVMAASTASIVVTITGRPGAAVAAAGLVVLHPDVLYLQATPMTEPLTLGLLAGAVALFIMNGRGQGQTWLGATLLALAVLTRYEAWPVAAVLIVLMAREWPGTGDQSWRRHPVVPVAILVALALVAASCWNEVMTGTWIVTSGFFRPTGSAGQPLEALIPVLAAGALATGPGLLILAAIGLRWMARQARHDPGRRLDFVAAAPLAAGLLFWYAAYAGHSMLARYAAFLVVPVVWLGTVGAHGLHATGRRTTLATLAALSGIWYVGLWALPPVFSEAAADAHGRDLRRPVIEALAPAGPQTRLLASMWSTAHVLHELADLDVPLRHVIHEGNGSAWTRALAAPGRHVDWIMLACLGAGNDRLLRDTVRSPDLIADFDLAARGGGFELYRRRAAHASPAGDRPRRAPCSARAP